jgi:hypothetical protein
VLRRPPAQTSSEVLGRLARSLPAGAAGREPASAGEPAPQKALDEILRAVVAEPEAAFRPVAVLYQDFLVRCRIEKLRGDTMSLTEFRRRLAVARAGVDATEGSDPVWERALALAAELPEDIQGVFLLLARAAVDGAPCPGDAELARICGSHSPRRARRVLSYMEERGFIATRSDAAGNRVIAVAAVEATTAPSVPEGSAGTTQRGERALALG